MILRRRPPEIRKSPDTDVLTEDELVSKILPIPNLPRTVDVKANISSLNRHRILILHKKLFEKQALADPSEVLEPVPVFIEGNEGFLSSVVEKALTDYFDNQPEASEITRAALVMANDSPPEELFE